MTATTLSAQQAGLTGLWRSGGDAQEPAATNPVAALPCAPTPLIHPLFNPLLHPLLGPSSATVGVNWPTRALFGLVRGSVGKLTAWRATRSRLHAGAVVSGRPPTNFVGGLPPGSPGHPDHQRWSDG